MNSIAILEKRAAKAQDLVNLAKALQRFISRSCITDLQVEQIENIQLLIALAPLQWSNVAKELCEIISGHYPFFKAEEHPEFASIVIDRLIRKPNEHTARLLNRDISDFTLKRSKK